MKRLLANTVLMLPSAYMTCLIKLRENNAKLENGDCLCHVSDTFVDVLCLALFIAFLCGWGTVAFYGELSELQDPMLTMKETDWTNYSFFHLVCVLSTAIFLRIRLFLAC